MVDAAREAGIPVAREGFADRSYRRDGSLQSRREPGAVLDDPNRAAQQALEIVREQSVTTVEGSRIHMAVDTLCIHGDNPHAVRIVRAVRETLEANGIVVAPLGSLGR
jgi:UPF0271 protein